MNISPHCRAIIFPADEVISCAVCNELLDIYLDAELANINVKHAYSEIWQHLQTCESCAIYYGWLYTLLQKTPASPLSRVDCKQFDLSFMPFCQPPPIPVATQPAWHMYLRPRLLGEPFLLRFSFSVDYLQSQLALFTPDPLQATAAAKHPRPPCTLLKQYITLTEQKIVVKMLASPLSVHLGLVHLQATFTATPALVAKLQAKLVWGKRERIVWLTETGAADLGPVLLPLEPPVNRSEDILAVTFEAIR